MDGFIGSIYLQYIGASLIWIFKKIQQKFSNKRQVSFNEILGKKENDNYKKLDYSGKNLAVGLIFVVTILMIIKFTPRILWLLKN
ncbi:MAG: hypothetical protein WC967_14310 [Balneolaceae bacterium]